MRLKTGTTMEETRHGKTTVCVEEIINGIRSCEIDVVSSMTNQVGLMLENLSLENKKDEKLQTPTELISQPRDGEEVSEDRSETDQSGETVEEKRVDEPRIPGSLVTLMAPCSNQLQTATELVSQPRNGEGVLEDCSQRIHQSGETVEEKSVDEPRNPGELVTLEAPCSDEEEDYSAQSSDEEIIDCLSERGPMIGVPCKLKPKPSQSGNFCKPSELLVTFNHASMPHNFPDYSCQNVDGINSKGCKRLMDKTRPEAPKYVRPQESAFGETAAGNMSGAALGSVKTIVRLNQMVGGTVYTRETPPPSTDQIFNGMIDSLNSYNVPDFLNLESNESNSNIQEFLNLESNESNSNIQDFLTLQSNGSNSNIQDFLNLESNGSNSNIQDFLTLESNGSNSNIQDFLTLESNGSNSNIQHFLNLDSNGSNSNIQDFLTLESNGSNSNIQDFLNLESNNSNLNIPDFLKLESNDSKSISQNVINLLLEHGTIHKNGVPSHRHLMENSYKNVDLHQQKGLNQQQYRFPPEFQRVRRDTRGSMDDHSEGYASDCSPPHEIHSPPLDSPSSVMTASPLAVQGSPPWRNLPSPASHKSRWSIDSGVSSPMSEDLNGYACQKSPRDGYGLHPQNTMAVLGPSYPARKEKENQGGNDVHSAYPETYFSEFIDENLDELNSALDVVKKDLIETEIKKKFTMTPQEGIAGVQDTATDSRIGIGSSKNMGIYHDIVGGMSMILSQPVKASESVGRLSDVIVDRTAKGYAGINGVLKPSLQGTTFVFTSANTSTPPPSLNTFRTVPQPIMNTPGKIPHSIISTPGTIPYHIVSTPGKIPHHIVSTPEKIPHHIVSTPEKIPHHIVSTPEKIPYHIVSTPEKIPYHIVSTPGTTLPRPIVSTLGTVQHTTLSTSITKSHTTINNCCAMPEPIVNKEGKVAIQRIVNKEGKVAIPVSKKKSTPAAPSQVLPLFIILPQSVPMKRSHFRNIAPKDPTKQVEKAAYSNGQPASISSPQISNCSAGKEETLSNDKGLEAKRLNTARRVVAEVSASDLKSKDEDDEDTCLHVTVCRYDCFMVQALLERLVREDLTDMINMQNLQGQDLKGTNQYRIYLETALYLAVSTNNAEMVRLLVEHGADVNTLAESKTSAGALEKLAAIHIVSTKGDTYLKTLQALLRAPGINLNQVNSDGHTALNCAILAHGKVSRDMKHINSIPIIQALIQAGADPNLHVQQSGKTGLMYALETRDLDLIEKTFQLVEPSKLDAVLKTQAFDGSTCLKIADSLKISLDQAGKQRLSNCLKSRTSRGVLGLSS